MTEFTQFDAEALLRVLVAHRVRFVVIGGVGAQLLGAPLLTYDLDICYARDAENLQAIAAALRSIDATLRGAPAGLPFRLDAKTLANGDSFTFETSLGSFDILGTPSGTSGFDELDTAASWSDIEGGRVRVAALDDLIRMKRAAGRVKDRVHLEDLGALRDELDRRGR
ncbi:MAG: hypothetical protein ABIZ34_09990 [Candidatus Limnocylindrales bacterium]